MSGKRVSMIMMLALVTGWIGGMVSGRSPLSRVGIAQDNPGAATVVKAHEFQLVDKAGVARAIFAVVDENPVLRFFDEKGTPQVNIKISLDPDPQLSVSREDEKASALLNLRWRGPDLVFCREDTPRAVLAVRYGTVILAFLDERHVKRMVLAIIANKPELLLYNEKQELTWQTP